MNRTVESKNKTLVLEAFDTLFNKRDYAAAEKFWSPVAEGNFVIVHGRFSNFGLPVNWIAADIVRIENGMLAEHWDVIEDEASKQESKSGLPMFGEEFSK